MKNNQPYFKDELRVFLERACPQRLLRLVPWTWIEFHSTITSYLCTLPSEIFKYFSKLNNLYTRLIGYGKTNRMWFVNWHTDRYVWKFHSPLMFVSPCRPYLSSVHPYTVPELNVIAIKPYLKDRWTTRKPPAPEAVPRLLPAQRLQRPSSVVQSVPEGMMLRLPPAVS